MAERLLRLTVDQKSLRHRRFESYSAHQIYSVSKVNMDSSILGPKTNGYLETIIPFVTHLPRIHFPEVLLTCSSVGRASDC